MTLKPENTPVSEPPRPKPKRFYKKVGVETEAGGFSITLDERPVKTPLRQSLKVRSEVLALAMAREWDNQKEVIDSEEMIMTKLANTAIDRVAPRRKEIIDELLSYAGSDLICYRAEEPSSLVASEQQNWAPYIEWFKTIQHIELKVTTGIIHVAQDQPELLKLEALYDQFDEFTLTAIHNMTTMLGSALLPLSFALGYSTKDQIWSAAHIEEDYQIERWGEDEGAAKRRVKRNNEFEQTCTFYRYSNQ